MTLTTALIAFAILFLAYSNGANDNFKGVATLFGSGTARYRTALAWATVTTLAGSLLALALARGLARDWFPTPSLRSLCSSWRSPWARL
jgi:PiT family inorganic phosphate transporter